MVIVALACRVPYPHGQGGVLIITVILPVVGGFLLRFFWLQERNDPQVLSKHSFVPCLDGTMLAIFPGLGAVDF